MKIFTSRYANKEIAKTNLIPVGISLDKPQLELAFQVAFFIKELAPTPEMLYMKYDTFKAKYFQKLGSLSIDSLRKRFEKISRSCCRDARTITNGNGIVLLCFEDITQPDQWCHRRMFAEWWERKTGEKIEEL